MSGFFSAVECLPVRDKARERQGVASDLVALVTHRIGNDFAVHLPTIGLRNRHGGVTPRILSTTEIRISSRTTGIGKFASRMERGRYRVREFKAGSAWLRHDAHAEQVIRVKTLWQFLRRQRYSAELIFAENVSPSTEYSITRTIETII